MRLPLARALLGEMQQLLARVYDTAIEHDVGDFLITDRDVLAERSGARALTDEQLVIVESADDGVELGLYIDAAVLDRLARRSPFDVLDESNLQDYCTALEGVSHFHYVIWSSTRQRPVSLLELELQAEVDKYVTGLQLLARQGGGRYVPDWHRRLFDRAGYAGGLDRTSLQRYVLANRHAARFCRALDERYLKTRRTSVVGWLQALRRFYRYGHGEKLRHVACA